MINIILGCMYTPWKEEKLYFYCGVIVFIATIHVDPRYRTLQITFSITLGVRASAVRLDGGSCHTSALAAHRFAGSSKMNEL
jgi:hypothetical protein